MNKNLSENWRVFSELFYFSRCRQTGILEKVRLCFLNFCVSVSLSALSKEEYLQCLAIAVLFLMFIITLSKVTNFFSRMSEQDDICIWRFTCSMYGLSVYDTGKYIYIY